MSINIPWLEVLKACYPNAQITEDTEILVVSPQYTADIAVIMSTTDRWVYIYMYSRQLATDLRRSFTIIEKAPTTRAFSWLKVPTKHFNVLKLPILYDNCVSIRISHLLNLGSMSI